MKINSFNTNNFFDNTNKHKSEVGKALENIAATRALSGQDSANMVIADNLLSQSNVLSQGIKNANDGIGMLKIADSTLSNLTKDADEINKLSVSMNNPALSQRERNMIQSKADALKSSMKQSLQNATFNGKNVFSGQLDFHTGNSLQSTNLNSPENLISSIDVKSQKSVENFVDDVNRLRSDIGSTQNAMVSDINNSLKQEVALRSSESQLQNNDISKNLNELNKSKNLLNAKILVQAHNVANLKDQVNRLLS